MSILIFILKIILLLLALVLTIFALVLLLPWRYIVSGEKESAIQAQLLVYWPFRIVFFQYRYENNTGEMSYRFFHLTNTGEHEKKEENEKAEPDETVSDTNPTDMSEQNLEKDEYFTSESHTNKDVDETAPPAMDISKKQQESESEQHTETNKKEKKEKQQKKAKNKSNSILDTIKLVKEKIGMVLQYPNRDLIYQYTKDFLWKEIKVLWPKQIDVYGVIGFSDPALTGQALGVIYALSPLSKGMVRLEGDFEKETLRIKGEAKGSFSFWALLWPLICYILKRPIWNIVSSYLKKDKKGKKKG